MKKVVVVSENFSAAHLYHQRKWTPEENRAKFGKCFTKHGHGHNYRLEASFKNTAGSPEELRKSVRLVTELLDHQHLNFVIPEFQNVVPTTENIALYLVEKLKLASPAASLVSLKLYEAEDLWVEIRTVSS